MRGPVKMSAAGLAISIIISVACFLTTVGFGIWMWVEAARIRREQDKADDDRVAIRKQLDGKLSKTAPAVTDLPTVQANIDVLLLLNEYTHLVVTQVAQDSDSAMAHLADELVGVRQSIEDVRSHAAVVIEDIARRVAELEQAIEEDRDGLAEAIESLTSELDQDVSTVFTELINIIDQLGAEIDGIQSTDTTVKELVDGLSAQIAKLQGDSFIDEETIAALRAEIEELTAASPP